jgi:hypothetical protein
MIILKQYPIIEANDKNKSTGILEKRALLTKSFLVTGQKNALFIANKQKIYSHLSLKYNKKKENGYLSEILFHGLNYSTKRVKYFRPSYQVDVHKSEVFVCDEHAANTFKSRIHKRRLVFFSYDQNLIKTIQKKIIGFKMPNSYTGKGLFERNDTYTLKEGKKRK